MILCLQLWLNLPGGVFLLTGPRLLLKVRVTSVVEPPEKAQREEVDLRNLMFITPKISLLLLSFNNSYGIIIYMQSTMGDKTSPLLGTR